MSRRMLTTYIAAVALAVGTAPLAAQDKGQAGARPNSGGGSSGSAVSRPSGGSGGGGGSSSAGSGSSSSAPSSSGVARPSGGSSSGGGSEFRAARPERRVEGRAVPRGTTERGETGRVAPGGSAASASSPDAADGRRRAVPAYSRPREGRPTTGTAVPRSTLPPHDNGNGSWYYYDPYYRYSYYYNRYPYGYYWPGYGFGVGYFYDPWLFGGSGAYDPYYYGGSGGYYSRDQYRDAGNLRLKVKPNHGQVFVDGYYAGEVDSFDGVFQKLTLDAGAHRIEIRAEGYETVQFEVMVTPGETVTYKGDLKRIQ